VDGYLNLLKTHVKRLFLFDFLPRHGAERLRCMPCRWMRIIEKLITLARGESDFFCKKPPFGQMISTMA